MFIKGRTSHQCVLTSDYYRLLGHIKINCFDELDWMLFSQPELNRTIWVLISTWLIWDSILDVFFLCADFPLNFHLILMLNITVLSRYQWSRLLRMPKRWKWFRILRFTILLSIIGNVITTIDEIRLD